MLSVTDMVNVIVALEDTLGTRMVLAPSPLLVGPTIITDEGFIMVVLVEPVHDTIKGHRLPPTFTVVF